MIRRNERRAQREEKLNRGVNLDYTPGQVLYPRAISQSLYVKKRRRGRGRTRGTSFHFYSTDRSDLRPCEQSIHADGVEGGI